VLPTVILGIHNSVTPRTAKGETAELVEALYCEFPLKYAEIESNPVMAFHEQVPVTTWVVGFSVRFEVAQSSDGGLPFVPTTIFPVITLVKVAGVTVTVKVTKSPIDGEGSETVIEVVVFEATATAAGVSSNPNEMPVSRAAIRGKESKRFFIISPHE
jgi:hypothetical protein